MYSAALIFEPGHYDDEFHRLNAIIDSVAKSLPGFLGVDSWQSTSGSLRNVTCVLRSYGDGAIAHVTPDDRRRED